MRFDMSVLQPCRAAALRTAWMSGCIVLLASIAGATAAAASGEAHASAVKIAVFDFELEDDSPSAVLLNKTDPHAATMAKVTAAAREQLASSGRYNLVDVSKADAKAVRDGMLRRCNGCEADIARNLGADESLIGIVRPITQTDYYVLVVIRDARTGKVLDEQEANLAGDESGWPTGARMLIKHQVLATPTPN